VIVRGFKEASVAGEHFAAAGNFVSTNDPKILKPFKDRTIHATDGRRYVLETDPNALHRIAAMDSPVFHEIYEITSSHEPDRGMRRRMDEEDRRQQRLRRLGTQNPICVPCGETHPAVFEKHHLAGRKHHDDQALVCANCHRKLTDKQRDHVPSARAQPNRQSARIGHYLLGLADLLAMIVNTLRKFGAQLIAESTRDN
jgi:hypothetical protein